MPKGTAIGTVYPTYSGKNAGNNLHRKNPPIGDSLGNAMHKTPRSSGGTKVGTGEKVSRTGPPEPRPRKRNRGKKPPTKAMASQPHMGKSGGSLAGQTMGKIV